MSAGPLVAAAASSGGLNGGVGSRDVALAVLLVVVAVVISRLRGVGLERDLVVATVRSVVQLLAVGFVLEAVLGGYGWATPVVLAVMVGTATMTSASRAKGVPGAHLVALTSVGVGVVATLGVLIVLGIVPPTARSVVPLGSMIITSAMNTTSLTLRRLRTDLAAARREVEARLSLAMTARQAAAPWQRQALQAAMLPTIDQTKVVGLVSLPGAMTGLLLAGVAPLAAIRVQLVVMYMLLGGNAFAALVAGEMGLRRLFTSDQQLIKSLRRTPS